MPQIEKAVPIPATASKTRVRTVLPFAEMEVNDSIFVKGDKDVQDKALGSIRRFARTHEGFDFVFASTGDGVRIWRTA